MVATIFVFMTPCGYSRCLIKDKLWVTQKFGGIKKGETKTTIIQMDNRRRIKTEEKANVVAW